MSEESLTGGCICGAVRYAIDEESPPAYVCHCSECRTRSGSAYTVTMPVWRTRLTIEGDVVQGQYSLPSGAEVTITACARCLTKLFSENKARPGLAAIRAGTLDNSRTLVPKVHMWTSSKLRWVAIPETTEQFETQPDDLADWARILEFERRQP